MADVFNIKAQNKAFNLSVDKKLQEIKTFNEEKDKANSLKNLLVPQNDFIQQVDSAYIDNSRNIRQQEELAINSINENKISKDNNINLQAEQSKELAKLKARENFRDLLFDYGTADTEQVSKIANQMLKSSFNTNYLINEEIPLKQRHSLEQNRLDRDNALRELNSKTNILYKQLKENYTDSNDAYMNNLTSYLEAVYPAQKYVNEHYEQAKAFSEGLEATKASQLNPTITDGLFYWKQGVRGVIDFTDGLINLVGGDDFIANNFGTLGISPFDIVSSDDYGTIDKIGAGWIISQTVRSLFEMGAVGFVGYKALNAANKALIAERTALITGENVSNSIIKNLDKQINIAKASGNTVAVRNLNALKKYTNDILSGKTSFPNISKDKLANLIGKSTQYYSTATLGGTLKNMPYVLMGLDYSRRLNDLVESREQGGIFSGNLNFKDVIGAFGHMAVDYATAIKAFRLDKFTASKRMELVGKELAPETYIQKLKEFSVGSIGEGIGEVLQTYIERQAANNYELPSLANILMSSNNSILGEERKALTDSFAIGVGAGGVVSAGHKAIHTGIDIISKLTKKSNTETPNILPKNSFNETEISNQAEIVRKRLEKEKYNTEKGRERQQERGKQEKLKKERIAAKEQAVQQKLKEEKIELKNYNIKTTNEGRIQELEYKKSQLREDSESVKLIDDLIEEYRRADLANKSLNTADALVNTESVKNNKKFNEAISKLLDFETILNETDKTAQELYEETTKDLADSLDFTTDDLKSIVELYTAKDKASHSQINKDDSITKENLKNDDSENVFYDDDKKQLVINKQDNIETQNSDNTSLESLGEQKEENEGKDIPNDKKTKPDSSKAEERDLSKMTNEQIDKLKSDEINAFFRTLSPEVALFAKMRTQERIRENTVNEFEPNEGYSNLRDSNVLIRLPYSDLEGIRHDTVTTESKNEPMLRFMDSELMLVSNEYYSAETQSIQSVKTDKNLSNPIQEALTKLNDINNETYQGLFNQLEKTINNNDSKEAERLIDEISSKYKEQINGLQRHIILLNAIISANPKKPLAKQIQINMRTTAKTIREVRDTMNRLSTQFNIDNKQVDIDNINNNSMNNILETILDSSTAFFSGIKNKILDLRSLDKESSPNEFKNKIDIVKKALKAIQKVISKFNSIFADKEFNQTYEQTLDLLEQGNSVILANLKETKTIEIKVDNEIKTINFNGVTDIADAYFYDLLYNIYNIKENGIDSKSLILESIISKIILDEHYANKMKETLSLFSEIFKNIKIELPITEITPEQATTGRKAVENTKTYEITLDDIINFNYNAAKALCNSEINSAKQSGLTEEEYINKNIEELRNKAFEKIRKNPSLKNEILNRLSVAIVTNNEISSQLDTLLSVGLLINTNNFVTLGEKAVSPDNKDNKNFTYSRTEDFGSGEKAFAKTLLGEKSNSNNIDSPELNAFIEMSKFTASHFLDMKRYNGNHITHTTTMKINDTQSVNIIGINKALLPRLERNHKESFTKWMKIMDSQVEASNDLNEILKAYDELAQSLGIKRRERYAMQKNLQSTGKVLYSSQNKQDKEHTEKGFLKIVGHSIKDIYNKIIGSLSNESENIDAAAYESKKNEFISKITSQNGANDINSYKQAIEGYKNGTNKDNPILKDIPLCYVPITQNTFDENNNLVKTGIRYVFSPELTILNEHIFNQIELPDGSKGDINALWNNTNRSNVDSVIGTIIGRINSIGDGVFKTLNAYENTENISNKMFREKNNVNYSKPVYYLSSLLPNGRTANKLANTEQDNKFLRELFKYKLPEKITIYEDDKLVEEENLDAKQWGGKKKPNANEINPNNETYRENYYGLLFSLAMAFGVDFDKIKIPSNQKEKFAKSVKKLNKLWDKMIALDKIIQDSNISQSKKDKAIQERIKLETEFSQEFQSNFKDIKIDYEYKGQSLTELLDGLLNANIDAKAKFNELWKEKQKEPISVFSEHPGISTNNGNVFSNAVNSDNFIDNIQTQDLLVYSDGKATFSAQNAVRFKGINETDVLSGILRGNFNINDNIINGQKIPIAFIREQAILGELLTQAKKLAKNNGDFDNFLKVLEDKGIDAYTIAIGPTTLTMRALRGTNTLLSSLYSQELLDRNWIKKPTQAPSYSESPSTVLKDYIEALKIPFGRAIQELFQNSNFANEDKDLLIEWNELHKKSNRSESEEQKKTEIENRIIENFKSSLNNEIFNLKDKDSLKDFKRIKLEILMGLNDYLSNPEHTRAFLFKSGVFSYFGKDNTNTINMNNLMVYLFSDELDADNKYSGLLYKDFAKIDTYYNNFDMVENTAISTEMINNANTIQEKISNGENAINNRYLFKNLKEEWFKGLEIKDGNTTAHNDYFEIKKNKFGGLTVAKTNKLNKELSELTKDRTFKDEDIDVILNNTLQFYISSEGSFLPKHKALYLKANPTLAIVQQNNAYIKQQRELLEDKLLEILDSAIKEILLDAYQKVKGKENITQLDETALADIQNLYSSRQIIKVNGKRIKFSDYVNQRKNKILKEYVNGIYNSFWSDDLYIQIFKKHPSLEDKSNFTKELNKSKDEMLSNIDNRLTSLLMDKTLISSGNYATRLSSFKTIMSSTIGQFNHPFESLFPIQMNNPHTQIFDAVIGNANNILRFMNTWDNSLMTLNNSEVDTAYIIARFYNELTKNMDKAFGRTKSESIEDYIKNNINNKDKIMNLLKFNMNILRHTIQLSNLNAITANNSVGLDNITDNFSNTNRSDMNKVISLRNEAYTNIIKAKIILNNQGKKDLLNEINKNIEYNIFGNEDINFNNKCFNIQDRNIDINSDEFKNENKVKVKELTNENKNNITKETNKLLKNTFNTKIANKSPVSIIKKVYQNIVNTFLFSKNHTIFNINRKNQYIDISSRLFNLLKIEKSDLSSMLNNDKIKNIFDELGLTNEDIAIIQSKINNQTSINDLVNTILSYTISKNIVINDTAINEEIIKSKINYNDLIIEANNNNNNIVKLDNVDKPINLTEYANKELDLLLSIFEHFKNDKFNNEIKSINTDIINNSIIGVNTALLNIQNDYRRLTNATASKHTSMLDRAQSVDVILYNKDTEAKFRDIILDDKTNDIIKENINKNKDNDSQTSKDNTVLDNIENKENKAEEEQKENTQKEKDDNNNLYDTDVLYDSDTLYDTNNITSNDANKVEESLSSYQKAMKNDIKEMKKDKANHNIQEELTMIETLLNGLANNVKKGIKFFTTNRDSGPRGKFTKSNNQIIINSSANRYTRIHEFLHATTTFGFDYISNESKYYISQISKIHKEVRSFLDNIEDAKKREEKIREIFGEDNTINPLERYNYIFNRDNKTSLQEFVAIFLSTPSCIRFLSSKEFTNHLNRVPEFKIEGNSRLGKLIKAIPILIGYIFNLIKRMVDNNPKSGFQILANAVSNLSEYNTKEGQQLEQDRYNNLVFTKTNKVLQNAGLVITKNVERYITKMKAINPHYNADNEAKEISKELQSRIDEIAKNVKTLRMLNKSIGKGSAIKRAIRTAMWLLQSVYYNNLGLKNLMSSPVKSQIVSNAMAELRQAAIENTIFDAKILLDFGIHSTKYLQKFVNSVNRALGFRTELDYIKEIASSNISKQISLLLASPTGLADRFVKDKQFKEAYSEGVNKLIVHQNLGDYFFGDTAVNRGELNELVDFVLNDNEKTNNRIKLIRKAKIESAMRALGIEIDSDIHKSIAKIVDSMGITRVTDKKNSLGTQNIEQTLNDLNINFENNNNGNEALKQLHQAITLSAILAPRINAHKDVFEYINSKTVTFKKTYMNSSDKMKDEIRESIKNIITLYKEKLDQLYTQKVLNFANEDVQNRLTNYSPLERMYYETNDDNYITESAFDYQKKTAYYSDSYKPYEYNSTVTLVSLDKTKDTFQQEKESLIKKGFKLINISSTSSTETFIYDGWIKYNNGKERRGFMYRALTHKGNVIQYLDNFEVKRMKPLYNEDYKKHRYNTLLAYGKDYTDDYQFANSEFFGLNGANKSFAGSETMLRDNISIKQLEEWTKLDTSLESAFKDMERTIQDNTVRNLNNNLIFQQVLLSHNEIKKRNINHHTETLFRVGRDYNGEVRVTFNRALTEKYGFELSRKDESDFFKLYIATNNGQLPIDPEIKIDTRLLGMLFGFDIPTFANTVENSPIKFKVAKGFETALRYLVKESRNNTIIRNPSLVLENFKSNLFGLYAEGIPFSDIFNTLPYYIDELNKYQKDLKEKARILNEITIKERQEYRDKANITAEQQEIEVNKLKESLITIEKNLKDNAVAPLMGQGLYTNIVEDAETSGWKWDNKLIDFVSNKKNLTKGQKTFLNEIFMTEQSDVYQSLAQLTRLGDFIPRVILYHHIIGKGRRTINGVKESDAQLKRRALDTARERFINYNTPLWSPTLRFLDRFGLVNYAKYAFACEKQILAAFKSAPIQSLGIVAAQLGMEAMGVGKIPMISSYLAESIIVDGKLPSGFLNPSNGLEMFSNTLYRWNFITP